MRGVMPFLTLPNDTGTAPQTFRPCAQAQPPHLCTTGSELTPRCGMHRLNTNQLTWKNSDASQGASVGVENSRQLH